MKVIKCIFISVVLSLICQDSIAQIDKKGYPTEATQFLIGNWVGTINAGAMKFTFAFKFWIDQDQILIGTLDCPEQELDDIPVDEIKISQDSLKLDIRSIQRKYHGIMDRENNVIKGIYIRNQGMNFPLTIQRTESEITINRPQLPKKPYAYSEEEISLINPIDGNKLSGTLTIPNGKAPFPAVILVSGSGAQDRDESAFGHKPFLVIADHLTRHGIAVLRFDDRGVGGSSGNHLQSTLEINSDDVVAAVGLLRSRKEIEDDKIVLIGHSEGGVIVSLTAVRCSNIAAVILLGAPGLSIEETLYLQNAMLRRAEGASESMIEHFNSIQRKIFSIVKEESNDSVATEKLRSAYSSNQYPLLSRNQKNGIDDRIRDLLTPYFRDIIRCDPFPILQKVQCPVLAITGEKDLQAPPRESLAAIDSALKSGGNQNYRLIEVPGINHLLQTCQHGTMSEYFNIEETVSPLVLKIITEWILKRYDPDALPFLTSAYLGQKPPGMTPEIFAPGIVSSSEATEFGIAFTADAKEFYFNRSGVGVMVCSLSDTGWTAPIKAPFLEKYKGGAVHIMYDGKRLLMNRFPGVHELKEGEPGGIWALHKTEEGWDNPLFLITDGMRATSTLDGTIYTTDISGRKAGKDEGIIARYVYSDSGYQRALDPDGGVNNEASLAHPFIAPDESYIIFDSTRSGGRGKSDLYLCFRLADGSWSQAFNSALLNTEESDWCASVSPDGKYLFFTRNGTGKGDIYWMPAKFIEGVRPNE